MSSHHRKLNELVQERAQRLALRLTLPQLVSIASDTRLPGEIAGAYGVSAAVILRIQQRAPRAEHRRKEALAAVKVPSIA